MDKLSALETYICAIQTGSLSGAARIRKISQPAASQQISALESSYNTRLLIRDKSGVRMTEPGELVYKRAITILEEHEALISELDTLSGVVAGELVVTANMGISQHVMGDVIVQLAKQHPRLRILLRADNNILNLDKENIDIAIRSGGIGNSGGIVRKIASTDEILVATPEYLDTVGRPKNPEDLINLDFIQYRAADDQIAIPLSKSGKSIQVPIKTGLTAQFPDLVFQALFGNLGFAKAPEFLVSRAINDGKLEIVLPGWQVRETDLFLVYPTRETLSPKVVTFLNALLNHMEDTQGINVVKAAKQVFSA